MCNCSSNKSTTASGKPKQITVAFPDGTKKVYDTDTQARVAAASRNGKLVPA